MTRHAESALPCPPRPRRAVVALVLTTGLVGCEARPDRGHRLRRLAGVGGGRRHPGLGRGPGVGRDLRQRFGGAPCSLFDEMRGDRGTKPKEVILSFAGNTNYLEPCVGTDLEASYRAQIARGEAHLDRARARRSHGPRCPTSPGHRRAGPGRDAGRVLPPGDRVIDGGKYVTPGRHLEVDPAVHGRRALQRPPARPEVPAGHNIVRANDLTHFCPGPAPRVRPLQGLHVRGWRYARALTEALSG